MSSEANARVIAGTQAATLAALEHTKDGGPEEFVTALGRAFACTCAMSLLTLEDAIEGLRQCWPTDDAIERGKAAVWALRAGVKP